MSPVNTTEEYASPLMADWMAACLSPSSRPWRSLKWRIVQFSRSPERFCTVTLCFTYCT